MKNIQSFIGIPYLLGGKTRTGVDCFGLVELIYKEKLCIDIPVYRRPVSDSHEFIATNSEYEKRIKKEWSRKDDPEFFNIIAISTIPSSKRDIVDHVGIYIDRNRMLHINRHTMFSCIERLENYHHRIVGFYEFIK